MKLVLNVSDVSLFLAIPTLILIHLLCAPYTKVEESFNIQAIHDILAHGIPIPNAISKLYFDAHYDHVKFPGSVPRTFVGAVLLAGIARPFVTLLRSPQQIQLLVRALLGLINAVALVRFRYAVQTAYGRNAARWYLAFQATQFHVMYYASRTLPNMFALAIATEASRALMLSRSASLGRYRHIRLGLYLMTFAGVVFRAEIAVLLASQTLYLIYREATHKRRDLLTKAVIPAGIAGLTLGLAFTVPIDTFFWQTSRPLWPELSGFIYNTVQGHASDWGTSPAHYYFTNAIPKLLLNPLTYVVCIPLALYTRATRQASIDALLPAMAFVGLYSLLPHKEWRFVIYILPSLTAVSASGAAWIWTRRNKSALYTLSSTALVCSVLALLILSLASLGISSLNYPGGSALTRLHDLVPPNASDSHSKPRVNVYLDNLACQTGVTRFLQRDALQASTIFTEAWYYDKTDDKARLQQVKFWDKFDYALVQHRGSALGEWQTMDVVYGYAGLTLSLDNDLPAVNHETQTWKTELVKRYDTVVHMLTSSVTRGYWPRIKLEPKIYILQRTKS